MITFRIRQQGHTEYSVCQLFFSCRWYDMGHLFVFDPQCSDRTVEQYFVCIQLCEQAGRKAVVTRGSICNLCTIYYGHTDGDSAIHYLETYELHWDIGEIGQSPSGPRRRASICYQHSVAAIHNPANHRQAWLMLRTSSLSKCNGLIGKLDHRLYGVFRKCISQKVNSRRAKAHGVPPSWICKTSSQTGSQASCCLCRSWWQDKFIASALSWRSIWWSRSCFDTCSRAWRTHWPTYRPH